MRFFRAAPKHVAVLAFPFGTHAGPLLSMVLRIAGEQPDVTFSFFSTSRSNASIFKALNMGDLGNIQPYNVYDGLPEDYVHSGNPVDAINLFIKAMPGNFMTAMDEAVARTGKKITCLVTDAFFWFAADMAKEMRAKWVPLWTAGPHAVLAHIYTDLLRERVCSNDDCGGPNFDFLPGFSAVKVSDLGEELTADLEQPFPTMLYKMGLTLPQATAVAMNSFADVHPLIEKMLKSKFKLLLNVGPFALTTLRYTVPDEERCLQWLEKREKASVIYISFGSQIIPPPQELTALAEALEECEFPFIWAFRGNPEKQLPNGFLERTITKGKVVSWAPQMQILQHPSVGVCVTHCGWNSILECIVGGVPMICRPFFGDQNLNTRILESEFGIGVGIENGVFTKQDTITTLQSIISSEKGKIMRQKILELKECAMRAVERDGSSIRDFSTLIKIVTS